MSDERPPPDPPAQAAPAAAPPAPAAAAAPVAPKAPIAPIENFAVGRAQLLQKGSDSRAESSASAAKEAAAGNRPNQATSRTC